ncbi:hypothetical protein OPQ81_000024 [Rhizoctonia solani]|nr:hypothetical protein OPQ81_000024 [Rhizoctonia solani]
MPFISLRESLALSKDKWKKRLHIDSRDASPGPTSTQEILAVSNGARPGSVVSPEPTEMTSSILHKSPVEDPRASTAPQTNTIPGKDTVVCSGIKFLLVALESSADAFGPLKSAISALNGCVEIYKSLSKGRREYEELIVKLERISEDLAQYISEPMSLVMTNSVKRFCADIEAEVRSLEEVQARSTGRLLLAAWERSDEIFESFRRIQGHLERLILNANMNLLKAVNNQTMEALLAGMSPARPAIYNSAESDDLRRGGCAPGTRRPQIDLLLKWAHNSDSGKTCWMNGMAGTGKTTIAYSVCSRLDETFELGASFFCSRVIPECRQIKYIIPSIAYQLARFSMPFRFALVKVLELDPDVHARALKFQYQKLIVEPLLKVQGSLPTDFIVVIDALDECENENSLGQILDLLLSPAFTLPIRFLLSSRPEPEIYRRMMSRAGEQGDIQLVLHELDSDSVKSDIEAYMRHELEHISLTDAQWVSLLERAGVLFIYASTTCRYIKQGHNMENLDEAVNTIVNSCSVSTGDGDENAIDELYSTILTAAFNKSGMSQVNKARMRSVLQTAICALEPMTLDALAVLLGLTSGKQVSALLQPLRSVLNITATTGLVNTIHASFPDFMFSPDRSSEFYRARPARNVMLAEACLQIIETADPKFNICRLPSSHLSDDQVENLDQKVNQAISPGLSYACCYWSAHLYLGEYREELVKFVRRFFYTRLLLWMEILNLTQHIRFGTNIIREAEKWCSERAVAEDLTKTVHDARQFVSVYASNPVCHSTPHIYVSMLPFWPRSRPISKAYMPRSVGTIAPTGVAITGRQLALLSTWRVSPGIVGKISLSADGARLFVSAHQTLEVFDTFTGDKILDERPTRPISSISVSPVDTRVVYGCYNDTIYLWNTHNGEKATELVPGHVSGSWSTAFSPDGSCAAFGSSDGNISIYSFQRADLALGPYKGHFGQVSSMTFSLDGSQLVSGSADKTIRRWNTRNGSMMDEPLEGHTAEITSVTYSPDGSRLASASNDGTIRVWDPNTGETVLGPLGEHSSGVLSVAFSPDGSFIASGSHDHTIRVYNALTGHTVLGPFGEHARSVSSVTFSPDSCRLFSGSHDGTIRVWNMQDQSVSGGPLPALALSGYISSIRYSSNGLRLVSCTSNSNLHMIHIWDVQTGEMVLGPLYGHAGAIRSVDYSPNDAYIVSASEDCTLRIWDARDGKDLHGPLQGHRSDVRCVRFSPDSTLVVSGSYDGTVRVWNVGSGQLVNTLLERARGTAVDSVCFSPDGHQIVSCEAIRGTIRVLNRYTGEIVVGPLRSRDKAVTSVEFSSDGSRILSCSRYGPICIWNAQTGQEMLVFGDRDPQGRDSVETSAAFSTNGLFVVSGSSDRTVCVWNAQNGSLVLGPLKGHTDFINDVRFSPDGTHVVSCSLDHTIRFWDVSSCGTNIQDKSVKDEDEPGTSNSSIHDSSQSWYLSSDGWVVDSQNRRLILSFPTRDRSK